jgi:hypothetical protein
MIVIAFAAAAIIASAVAVLFIAVVFSVQGEDRHGQLPHQARGPIARSVRRLTGLRVCQPGEARLQTPLSMQKASREFPPTRPAHSPAQVIDELADTPSVDGRSA